MNFLTEIDDAMNELDFGRALRLIKMCSQDDLKAEVYEHLGYIYKVGNKDVAKNPLLSKRYYHKFYCLLKEMAETGDANAALRLARGYQYGDNIEKDESRAMSYYLAAASAGDPDAQFHLGCIYRYGWCGVDADLVQFEHWLDKAVELDWPEALHEKSKLLRDAGDFTRADSLLLKAAVLGFWPAVRDRS
jgi:TPR repeat protein